MADWCEHQNKVYANYSYMTDPPQTPWICPDCGEEGIEQNFYREAKTYEDIKRIYYGKSVNSPYPKLTIKTVVDHEIEDLGYVVTSMVQKNIKPEKEGKLIYEKDDKSKS